MHVLLILWRNLLASVRPSVCKWVVGQFGSKVLIRCEEITWFCQCFAIGFDFLRIMTVHKDRPSPLDLYSQLAVFICRSEQI